MGCGSSNEAALERNRTGPWWKAKQGTNKAGGKQGEQQYGDTGGVVHASRNSYEAVPLLHLYTEVEDALLKDVHERRIDRQAARQRLEESRGAYGLQARGVLMFVYSTPETSFHNYLADCPEYVDLPTFGANASNAIPGSTMLARAAELAELVQQNGGGEGGAAAVAPNATLLGEPLNNMLRLKAIWGKRLLAVILLMFRHPVCGRMALVQPLLGAACMARLTNWAPELDPVFEVLLRAGASPRVRNSLNMTPLMLLAVALANELDKALYVSDASAATLLGGSFTEAARLAGVAARLLLRAGADPRDTMAGFGAAWAALEERQREAALPAVVRPAKEVLHMESYTAHAAYVAMMAPHAALLSTAPPEVAGHLAAFEALLRDGLPPGDGGQGQGELEKAEDQEQARSQEPHDMGSEAEQLGEASGRPSGPPADVTAVRLEALMPGGAGAAASGAAGGDGGREPKAAVEGVEAAEAAQNPPIQALVPPPSVAAVRRGVAWPWVQAMSNIAWAVSQVTMAPTAAARRSLLGQLVRQAPFELPGMAVVSLGQLRQLGCIPRYTTQPDSLPADSPADSPPPFQPLSTDSLPPDAVTVFVSHRWLGRGCPDDEAGTKLKQVFAIADLVAADRGVPVEHVYLWLDYSVVDQSNPMPGVQALPIYIACCDEFVYVEHPEYWQRAWCLTEQFMAWKLAVGERKHALDPASLALTPHSARERPPDPTYGKLAVEADRVALATMTSIMPYDGDD